MSRLSPMRPFFILAPLGMLYLAIFGRVVQLHAYPEDGVIVLSDDLETRKSLVAPRGVIYDRNGVPMVFDQPVYNLAMRTRWEHRRYHPDNRPDDLTNEQIAEEIAEVAERVKVPVEVLAKAVLDPDRVYVPLRRNIDLSEAQALQAYLRSHRGMGLSLDYAMTRVYPLGRVYGNVLGVVSDDGVNREGSSGLEFKFDKLLQGTPGSKDSQMVTSAFGVNPARGLNQAKEGNALYTTLNADLGARTREVLARSMVEHRPTWVSAVVMNVNSGEVLAMVGLPDFDPRDPAFDPETGLDTSGEVSSYALAMENPFVPGSTFKPFMVGYAIDRGIVGPNEMFEDPGQIFLPGRRIGNAPLVPGGPKDAALCLIHSSNVVSTKISQRLGIKRCREMLSVFGFWDPVVLGQRTFPSGIQPKNEQWERRNAESWTLASVSFGHQMMMSPLRYAACFSSLVNGGHRIEPHMLKAGLDATEKQAAFRAESRHGVDRPLKESTSNYLIDVMETMVERRIGSTLPLIEGVRWGGKSGTAELETNEELKTCSFAAFGPIPDPEILVLVVVKWPRCEGRVSGTKTAGPLAGEILQDSLRILGLLPEVGDSSLDSGASNANLKPRLQEVR